MSEAERSMTESDVSAGGDCNEASEHEGSMRKTQLTRFEACTTWWCMWVLKSQKIQLTRFEACATWWCMWVLEGKKIQLTRFEACTTWWCMWERKSKEIPTTHHSLPSVLARQYATWRGTHSLGNPEHLCKHQALRCSLNIVSSVKRTAHIKNALGALTQGVEDNNWDIVYSERREPPYGYEVE